MEGKNIISSLQATVDFELCLYSLEVFLIQAGSAIVISTFVKGPIY